MTTFVRYCLRWKKSDCAYGDLARDMLIDVNIRRTWCYKTFKKYLEDRGACGRCLDVLEQMNESYILMQRSLYRAKIDTPA